jgi:hypothetical protein
MIHRMRKGNLFQPLRKDGTDELPKKG